MKPSKPTHRAIRAAMWAKRLPQMMATANRHPWWQFRAVGDARDPEQCKAMHGRIERFDSDFWATNAPWKCKRTECRCTVRMYSDNELKQRTET
jgi:uncharacterized protein with gpF-like domain